MSESVAAATPRPGAAALDNMALMKSESRIFKVPKIPKGPKKRGQTKVLEEDLYNECIGRIIQRDFFPDTERLHAQNEYLEASENKDYARLQEITRKYSGARPPTDPRATPATFETPRDRLYSPAAETVRGDGSEDTVRGSSGCTPHEPTELDVTNRHSLDSFLARHTSEDNSSYERVIALEERKRAARCADQFESERTAAALAADALALPSIERQADQSERPHELDTWTYKAKNYIMYVPDGSDQPAPIKPELQHHNTRLQGNPFNMQASKQMLSEIAKAQGASASGKIGVDGACVSVRGFVCTPSPRPGAAGDESPLMTWGEIEGTPFRLDGGDTPLPAAGAGAAYRMLEWGARERIGMRLAEQAARKRRPTTPRVHATTPRTSTERLASMSPAARRFAAKHLASPRRKLTPATVGVLSHSATTPKARATPRGRPLVATPGTGKKAATPKVHGNTEAISDSALGSIEAMNDLTDNLLQINVAKRTRLKAQDFFK